MKKLLILIGLMALMTIAYGATRNAPYVFDAMIGLDSVRSLMWEDSTLTDSVTGELNTFPETGFYVINDVNPWTIQNFFYWNGNSTPITGWERIDYRVTEPQPGQYTVQIYVLSTADSTPVNGVSVLFNNWAITNPFQTKTTNANGLSQIVTNSDSITHSAASAFYTFHKDSPAGPDEWDSVTYAGTFVDTIWATPGTPSAPSSLDFVAVYADIGKGQIDSVAGTMFPRTNLKIHLNLIGGPFFTSDWVVVPESYVEKPNSDGRVVFYVPATTILTPSSGYYIMTYTGGRRSQMSGEIRRFILDTIPDPIDVVNTTPVP